MTAGEKKLVEKYKASRSQRVKSLYFLDLLTRVNKKVYLFNEPNQGEILFLEIAKLLK